MNPVEMKKNETHFQMIYATVIKVDKSVENKKELEKIILCDVQNEIYSKLEKIFINIIKESGFPEIKFNKKIDFYKLYEQRLN